MAEISRKIGNCKRKDFVTNMGKYVDLTGMTFGKLKVIEFAGGRKQSNGRNRGYWRCMCECGNETTVLCSSLLNGTTKSCGCFKRERSSKANKKHGMNGSRLNWVWRAMRGRCLNSNSKDYKRYGGRGITICNEWDKFFEFYNWAMNSGYKDGLTLDRIDVNGNYCPENCRWVTRKKQANNIRRNIVLEYKGEVHTLSEWADIIGIPYRVLSHRYYRGWEIEDMLERELGGRRE